MNYLRYGLLISVIALLLYFIRDVTFHQAQIRATSYSMNPNQEQWDGNTPPADGWSETIDRDIPVYWLRSIVPFNEKKDEYQKWELWLDLTGSSEVYFNGTLIGKNGVISRNPDDEKPGLLYSHFIVPDSLLKAGDNEIWVKASSHRKSQGVFLLSIELNKYTSSIRIGRGSTVAFILCGFFLGAAIFYLIFYLLNYKEISLIIFASLSLATATLILFVFEYSITFNPLYYYYYEVRYLIIRIVTLIISVLLPLFLLNHFRVPHIGWIIGGLISLLILYLFLPLSYLVENQIMVGTSILVSLGAVLYSIYRKYEGSVEILIGFAVTGFGMQYYHVTFYLGIAMVVISIFYTLSLKIHRERKLHEESLVRSSRLESQLLRKNIQPHFLMNTLTNIISLIQTDKNKSIELIEALADEFTLMIEISEKKLVPLKKELELCEAHLKVMSIRNEEKYELMTAAKDGIMIPPAIIHTIIENGITHNKPVKGKMIFDIDVVQDNAIRIIVRSHGQLMDRNGHNVDGTGMKYIKSRLEESYPGKWKVISGPEEDYWKTQIEIAS